MIKNIYICDKCKTEFDKRDKLTPVKIESEPYSSYPSRRKVYLYKELCDECCKKIGLVFVEPKTEAGIEKQAQTLQDRLFEIAQEIVLSCTN